MEVAKTAGGGVGAVWLLRQRHRHRSGGEREGRSPVLIESDPAIYLGPLGLVFLL